MTRMKNNENDGFLDDAEDVLIEGTISKNKKKLLFIPLGGVNDIGLNMTLYQYDGDWIIVDMGIGFASSDEFPGVTVLLPDISFIENYKKDIKGIFITHAHQDHIGAISYFWHLLDYPIIYSKPFTIRVIKDVLAKGDYFPEDEEDFDIDSKFYAVGDKEIVELGKLRVEMIHLTHSIPEMHALMIRTPAGNIFHTGDYNQDDNPVIGNPADMGYLRKIGEEGVLAMVCDSTNIFVEEHTESEGTLALELEKVVESNVKKDNVIVFTTFASNIVRLYSIAKAAAKVNRKVVLAGRALWNLYRAAMSSGYLLDLEKFIDISEINKYRRDELVIICTGCQSEEGAVMYKLAHCNYNYLSLQKDDVVIFSSKIIPGNDKKIFRLFNKLLEMGVKVLNEMNSFVHVSGHASRKEIAEMYDIIKPTIAIPVHGEPAHLYEHRDFAYKNGIKESFVLKSGEILSMDQNGSAIVGRVENGYIAVDGNVLVSANNFVFKERNRMANNGTVFVTIGMGRGNMGASKVRMTTCGLINNNSDEAKNILQQWDKMLSQFVRRGDYDRDSLKKRVVGMVRRIISDDIGKSPEVMVHIV